MSGDVSEVRDRRFLKSLQQLGLNAYEARTWLVLLDNPAAKALNVAPRAQVPRQKIYEVLNNLVEKGFVRLSRHKTQLYSAVEPNLAIPAFVARQRVVLENGLLEQSRTAAGVIEQLARFYGERPSGRGTLDYLKFLSDPAQSAAEYLRMLREARSEYLEFSRPPFAADPSDDKPILRARRNGVTCRILIEGKSIGAGPAFPVSEFTAAGVQIRHASALPLKLALFDGRRGILAMLDSEYGASSWTALCFDHEGFAEAMRHLFEERWRTSTAFSDCVAASFTA